VERFYAQQRAYARDQLGLIDRFRQEVVGARLDALDSLLVRVERGHQYHRKDTGARVLPDAPADLVAIHARHHHVQEHEIGLPFLDALQGLGAGGGSRHLVALRGQKIREKLDVERRVIDDEDSGRFGHGFASLAPSPSPTVSRNNLMLIGFDR
jgi:hypothetical protein